MWLQRVRRKGGLPSVAHDPQRRSGVSRLRPRGGQGGARLAGPRLPDGRQLARALARPRLQRTAALRRLELHARHRRLPLHGRRRRHSLRGVPAQASRLAQGQQTQHVQAQVAGRGAQARALDHGARSLLHRRPLRRPGLRLLSDASAIRGRLRQALSAGARARRSAAGQARPQRGQRRPGDLVRRRHANVQAAVACQAEVRQRSLAQSAVARRDNRIRLRQTVRAHQEQQGEDDRHGRRALQVPLQSALSPGRAATRVALQRQHAAALAQTAQRRVRLDAAHATSRRVRAESDCQRKESFI